MIPAISRWTGLYEYKWDQNFPFHAPPLPIPLYTESSNVLNMTGLDQCLLYNLLKAGFCTSAEVYFPLILLLAQSGFLLVGEHRACSLHVLQRGWRADRVKFQPRMSVFTYKARWPERMDDTTYSVLGEIVPFILHRTAYNTAWLCDFNCISKVLIITERKKRKTILNCYIIEINSIWTPTILFSAYLHTYSV